MNLQGIIKNIEVIIEDSGSLVEKVDIINELRSSIHKHSPFKNEPVDFVKWVPSNIIIANDYNPNKVAPPEMELLEISIRQDGYTQPIVTFPKGEEVEVVDGFHRHRVGSESEIIKDRILGFLPTVIIKAEQCDKKNRIASTIRHNRARGKHQIDAMSEIVLELKNRNWKNKRIAKELGMDEEEILRLCQISGLEDIFKDDDFSKAWNIDDSQDDFIPLTDEITEEEKEKYKFKSANTNDENRIFHTFYKWECQKAGFYNSSKPGMTKDQAEREYANFLVNDESFKLALEKVITEWRHSCEHYLTNKAMNRIAWLGQASVCCSIGIPSKMCGGFNLLNKEQQFHANTIALEYLNKWFIKNGRDEITMGEALSIGRQVEIY